MNKQDNVSIFIQIYKKIPFKNDILFNFETKERNQIKVCRINFFHHANCTKENCTTFYLTNRLKGMFKTKLGYAYTVLLGHRMFQFLLIVFPDSLDI